MKTTRQSPRSLRDMVRILRKSGTKMSALESVESRQSAIDHRGGNRYEVYHPIGAQVVVSSSGQSLNYTQAVLRTFEQFRFGFANAVDESDAHELHEMFAAPGSGVPIFKVATANLNPRTEAWVDTENPDWGPLLIISAEYDHTVP
jgi:hypothetical protein